MAAPTLPVRVAVANDYEIIVAGLAELLERYPDRLQVVEELLVGDPVDDGHIDVVLYDTYGRAGIVEESIEALLKAPQVRYLAVFSLDLSKELIEDGLAAGATGFISKALSGDQIAEAIVRVAGGEVVMAIGPDLLPEAEDDEVPDELQWPGREDGLTQRESQVLVLVSEGLTNAEVAKALYLNVETVKTHMRKLLTKLDARNRVEAAAYAHRTGAFRRYQPAEPDAEERRSPSPPRR